VSVVKLRSREIVDTVTAVMDQPVEFLDPDLSAIVQLSRRARPEAARKYRENQCLEYRFELSIERAVYEDVVRRKSRRRQILFLQAVHGVRCQTSLGNRDRAAFRGGREHELSGDGIARHPPGLASGLAWLGRKCCCHEISVPFVKAKRKPQTSRVGGSTVATIGPAATPESAPHRPATTARARPRSGTPARTRRSASRGR
jgi:hypothetical protein